MRMRVGSITEKRVCDCIIPDAYCPKCNKTIPAPMLRTESTGRIMFIPFIKSSSPYFTICPVCKFQYNLRPQVGQEIVKQQSAQLLYTECCYYLDKERTSAAEFADRSEKKVWIGAILAFFLGIFGIQNLYMGHMKRFLISICMDIAALILILTAILIIPEAGNMLAMVGSFLLAFNLYWGIIDCIRILSGHAKDGNGCYIMTNRQYRMRKQKISSML